MFPMVCTRKENSGRFSYFSSQHFLMTSYLQRNKPTSIYSKSALIHSQNHKKFSRISFFTVLKSSVLYEYTTQAYV